MKKRKILIIVILFPFICSGKLSLEYVNSVNNTIVFRDLTQSDVFYYSPGQISLNVDAQGKPDFKFLQMRYSGSEVSGDKGVFLYKTLLQFKVNFKRTDPDKLYAIKLKMNLSDQASLFPLALDQIKTFLVYSTVSGSEKRMINGFIEENSEQSGSTDREVWNEKTFSVSLDNESSQLFKLALENGSTVLTLSYEYYTNSFIERNKGRIEILAPLDSLNPERFEELKSFEEVDTVQAEKMNLIYADGTAIRFELKRYPELFLKVDINESQVPPDFAVMEIRCYDFHENLRQDLYSKQIEIEATGLNNEIVRQRSTFYSYAANDIVHTIKFPFAVRMKAPYKFRTSEIKEDGSKIVSKWVSEKNWAKIIDITTKLK